MDDLHFSVYDFRQAQLIGHVKDLVYFRIQQLGTVAHHCESDFRSLIDVVGTDFGDRYIKIVAQFGDDRFDDLAFAFQ